MLCRVTSRVFKPQGSRSFTNINGIQKSAHSFSPFKIATGAAVVALGGIVAYQFATDSDEKKETSFASPFMALTDAAKAADIPSYGVPGTKTERTFIAIKPDGVNRHLIGEVIERFERKGYKLVGIKMLKPTKEIAEKHYADLAKKPFYPGLVKYFSSGPIVAMVLEGKNVIAGGRKIVGATDPDKSEPGSVRGDLCIQVGRNIIHGSDAPASAQDEITLWFKDSEITNWEDPLDKWTYES